VSIGSALDDDEGRHPNEEEINVEPVGQVEQDDPPG